MLNDLPLVPHSPPAIPPPWRVVLFTDFAGEAVIMARQLLEAMGHKLVGIVTSPGPRGRGRGTHLDIVAAAPRGTDVLVSNRPAHWAAMLAPLRPDLIVSASFPWVIPDDVIALPRLGAINLHGGLLPERRGPNSFGWAYRLGDPEVGFTVHWLESGLDTGPILGQLRVPTGDGYFDELLPTLFAQLPGLMAGALAKVAAGDPGAPQDESQAFYASDFDEEYRLIDWGRPASEVHNQCRAWMALGRGGNPGAIGIVDGQALRILRTRVTAGDPTASAGSVLQRDGDTLVVQCGDGALLVPEHAPVSIPAE